MEKHVSIDWLGESGRHLRVTSPWAGPIQGQVLGAAAGDDPTSTTERIRVLAPDQSLFARGLLPDLDRRRRRLERSAGRRLSVATFPRTPVGKLQDKRHEDLQVWIESRLQQVELRLVPAELALARAASLLPTHCVRGAYFCEGDRRVACLVTARSVLASGLSPDPGAARWLAFGPIHPHDQGTLSEATILRATELGAPDLAPWQWLATGAALASREPGSFPVIERRDFRVWRERGLAALALTAAGYFSMAWWESQRNHRDLQMELSEQQRRLEFAQWARSASEG